MSKSIEKQIARKLRQDGNSLGEIAKHVGVSKSTVGVWCRDIVLNKSQILKLLKSENLGKIEGREKAWEWHRHEKLLRFDKFHKIGYDAVKVISSNDLFLIGLALYWSEGSKNDGRVLFTNSDPKMIKLYIRWLVECLGIHNSQITCRISINELHSDRRDEIEKYWVKVVGLPFEQFTLTSQIHSTWKKTYENWREYYGVLAVRVRKSTNLSYQIMGSIDRLREMSGSVVK